MVECLTKMKFTKHGVRILPTPPITRQRAKSNEYSFRIRNNSRNVQSQSLFTKPMSGVRRSDFGTQYKKLQKNVNSKINLLNENVINSVGEHAKTSDTFSMSTATNVPKKSNQKRSRSPVKSQFSF